MNSMQKRHISYLHMFERNQVEESFIFIRENYISFKHWEKEV